MHKKVKFSNVNLVFEEMEPRLLLSADGLAVLTETNVATTEELVLGDNEINTLIVQNHTEQSSPVVQTKQYNSELVILDSRVPNFQQLHNDIIRAQQQDHNINVVLLDAHRDGLEQIYEALSKYNNLDAVHIVSHGESGKLQLGATQLDKHTLKHRSEEIKQWQAAFVESGDLLLYGCNLAGTSNGQSLVNELAKHTAADVAASDDLTGNSILGGDWDLEYQTGEIESSLAFSDDVQQNWQGTLEAAVPAGAEAQPTIAQGKLQQEQQAQLELEAQQAAIQQAAIVEEERLAGIAEEQEQVVIAGEQRQEIIFIDDTVDDYQAFIDDLNNNSDGSIHFEIVLLDSQRDGIEQISETLDSYNDVDAIHILSHGNDGSVKVGGTWLDANNLNDYSDDINTWASSLDENADILIYGCNLAESESGEQFVDELAQLTGADVAASDDKTGIATLGGDWDLEYESGYIETELAVSGQLQSEWNAVLATPEITSDGGGATASISVEENITAVTTVTATDADSDPITYSISGGTDAALFSIDASSGVLTFNSAPDFENPTDSNADNIYQVSVQADDGNTGVDTQNLSVTVTDITGNEPPVITSSAPAINYTEGDPATIIDPSVVLTDPDSADFDGGVLQVDLDTTGSPTDTLSIRDEGIAAGQIGVSGNTVTYGGIVIGTHAGGATGSDPLTVIFNVNADVTAIQALLRNITYENTSNNPSETQRSINFSISDGDGGVSNVITKLIVVNSVNFAPVITGANDLTAINEDLFNSGGTLVSILTSGWITDADLGSLEGIAVVSIDNTNGSWEFSINSGTSWTAFGSPSTNDTRLLAANADTFVRFVPDPDWNGTVTNGITFHAWDQTTGVNGDTVDITSSGNVRDQFDSVSYSNNDGTAVWTSDWIETNDSGSPNNGNVRIESGKLHLDSQDADFGESVTRSLDLSGASTAVLTFDYDGYGAGGLETIAFEISNDGGSTWTLLGNMDVLGNVAGSKSYNLESYTTLTADMQLRFRIAQGFDEAGQHINFDNVDIAFSGTGVGGSASVSIATASSSITVNSVNDAPTTSAVTLAATTEDSGVRVITQAELLANANDVDGDPLTATSLAITSGTGSLVDNGDGTWSYTPALNDDTSVSFSYTITDTTATIAGSASLDITSVNDAPVTNNDSASVNEGQSVNINLATNDTDVDNALDLTNITITSAPSNGSVVVNADGTVDYTHDGSETIADSFTYTILDVSGAVSNTATVTLTVNPVNDAPVANNDSASVNEGQSVNINLATNDTDAEGAVDLTSIVITSGPSNGAVVVNADGTVDYTHDGSETIADSFTYTILDASGAVSNVATVSLTINPVNDAPVANNDSAAVNEGQSVNINLATNDTDADNGLDITSIVITSTPANGAVVVNADGTVDYTHDGSETLADSFTYTILDNSGTVSNTGTVSITVTPVNDIPVIGGVDTGSVTEDVDPDTDTLLETGGALTIVDSDVGESSFVVETITGTYGDLTIDALGNWNYSADNTQAVIQNLAATDTLTDTISVTSFDGTTHNIVITIGGVNDAPTALDDNPAAVNEGGTAIFDLAANDFDIDNALDLNSIVITGAPANGSLIVNGDGTVSYTHDGSETLSDSFSYTISDITGAISNIATVTVTVNPVNDAPLALDDNPATVNEAGTAIFDLAANDSDIDNALDLNSIVITGAPANGSLIVNGDGTVSYTHDGSQTSTDSFSYTISDVSGAISNVATVNVSVNLINNAPTTTGIVDVTVNEDSAATSIDLNAAFDDVDNLDSELSYSITGNTSIGLFSSAAVNAVTGELVLDYAADVNGSSQISIRATDPSGASVDTLFTVTVTPVNDSPVLVANAGMTAVGTSSEVISNAELSVSDIDNTDTVLVYTVTALPTNGVLLINGVVATVNSSFTEDDIVNNRVSYQSDGSGISDQFAFTVSDGAGGTISNNTFNIVVQIALPEPDGTITIVDPEPLPDSVLTTTVDIVDSLQSEVPVEAESEIEDWYVGSDRTPPQSQQAELTLEPAPQQAVQNDFDYYEKPVQINEPAEINFSTANSVADIQVKSIKALWVAIDEMKQQIDKNVTEDMTQIEFRAAAVSSSGVALTAGVVAWVLRGGALMTSLISTIPLWKAYDPLPILAYRDDEDEEKNITEDKIPASLEEMKKIKALKEKMEKDNQVDDLFSDPGFVE